MFTNIEDARNALGRIKKESWHRADLTVILPEGSPESSNNDSMELAAEFAAQDRDEKRDWSGLRRDYWDGLGKIRYGTTFRRQPGKNQVLPETLAGQALQIVQQGIKDSKVVTIIDFEPELRAKLRVILESRGAEVLADQAST
jgi:hypothetical protein